MIPYAHEYTGLRTYRLQVTTAPSRRWPWLLVLLVLGLLLLGVLH